uniref:Uncharacterized protein n=1 Tax=Brassica oleracea TaxID=3712 RepID=A0A3P6FVK2_BRAOL|nr:unnamed protein product [Brassica oleracea]
MVVKSQRVVRIEWFIYGTRRLGGFCISSLVIMVLLMSVSSILMNQSLDLAVVII